MNISHKQLKSIAWELIPICALSWWRLNQIKLVYNPDQPDGQLNSTASGFNSLGTVYPTCAIVHRFLSTTAPKEFNQLGQYTSIIVARPTATQNLLFSFLVVALSLQCFDTVGWATWRASGR